MEYFDMLLETGRLSDVGYAIKENVGRAYRRGIELAAVWQATPWFAIDANLTLSDNKIKNHTEYISYINDDWDPTGKTKAENFGKTKMLMSPSVIGYLQFSFTPFKTVFNNSLKTTTLSLGGKYVGKQYLDNTMTESRSVPGYCISNLSLTHEFNVGSGKLGLGGYINNLFNTKYYSGGWCYKNVRESDGVIVDGIGIFPQAPINFMLKVSYRF